jgi:long-chain acyl-CoA synthetase
LRIETWTYGRLRRAAHAVASQLRDDLRLEEGDHVVICAPGSPEAVALHFGTMLAGLVSVPLDLGSSNDLAAAVVRKVEAKLFVGTAGRPLPDGCRFLPISGLDCDRQAGPWPRPTSDRIAEIVFTSGTTGDPKGTMLSHSNIMADVHATQAIVRRDVPLRLVSVLPLSHMLEQTIGLYLPLLGGGSVHYAGSVHPRAVLRELRRVRATGMVVVPRVLELLLKAIDPNAEAATPVLDHLPVPLRRLLFRSIHATMGGSFRFALCGGASLGSGVRQAWERLGIRIIEGYGSTECSPVIASNTYDERHAGTVGKPLPGVDVRIADDGEVLVRGRNVASGYWRDPVRTAEVFDSGGWFHTGDIGELGSDGTLSIMGRLGDRIVLPSGMKVFPSDPEAQLRLEDTVADCAVIGLPDESGREHVHAVVIPRSGVALQRDAAAEAVRRANTRLSSHQQMTGFSIWEGADFPRTSLGKIRRAQLRDAVLARSAAAAHPPEMPLKGPLAALRPVLARMSIRMPEGASPDTPLNLDSLGRVELATVIEQDVGLELDEDRLAEIQTLGQLANLLREDQRAAVPERRFADWPLSKPARLVRSACQQVLFPAVSRWADPFRVEHAERLEAVRPPLLLIANHSSHADTVAILRALPAPLRAKVAVAAAADYFFSGTVRGLGSEILLNAFPFSRSGRVRASLERCGELVDAGWSILIYPEGTRSPTGVLQPFKGGIGLLARGLRVPIVPIGVTGTRAVLPKGATWPQPAPVTVRFGDPILVDPSQELSSLLATLHHAVADLVEPNHIPRPAQEGERA